MTTTELLNGVVADGDSSTHYPKKVDREGYVIAQVEIAGTATVTVYGRLLSDYSWVAIKAFTASGAERVTAFPEMKMTVSGWSSGATSGALTG
jgi:hypothetical protein